MTDVLACAGLLCAGRGGAWGDALPVNGVLCADPGRLLPCGFRAVVAQLYGETGSSVMAMLDDTVYLSGAFFDGYQVNDLNRQKQTWRRGTQQKWRGSGTRPIPCNHHQGATMFGDKLYVQACPQRVV